ncbi:hypothetical protein [Guptibacillus hwajinpoensis]|uniref:hypothetical protein n=1 Tax=Guptibacillus hwajinpoensis TaxID=208199 RepID=UPI001CFE0CF4|nr:hypothetical protein [Pseudalkalibacillus hwajinpoensis]WLR59558.1 hypothetical protein LC071_20920 [Pseudalkalibacillus hwajinpoensis]
MSEKKRKPQVIHVDKLIVKANEVIIHDDREHKRYEDVEENTKNRRDPWGFFGSNDEGEREEAREDKNKGGFNWF